MNRKSCTCWVFSLLLKGVKVKVKFVSTGRSVSEKNPLGAIHFWHAFFFITSLPSSIPPTHPSILTPSFSHFSTPSFFPSSLFVHRDWLLGPTPGAETLANSVALHCVGWKRRPSCEVSVRPRLINEQTGRQSGPSLVFLSWINEAFLKDTPHCSSHWSNIPQHLTLPNFL